jgi:hypothetical protein
MFNKSGHPREVRLLYEPQYVILRVGNLTEEKSRASMSEFPTGVYEYRRSQWPRGLRHELSSLARTLGSWVRIPLKRWTFVRVYSVFVLLCVGSSLATG